jgi:hypothetical protein
MRRRDVLSLIGGATVSWPRAGRAQQRAALVIGFLGTETPDLFANRLRAYRQGLTELGFAEGRNVTIEYRWAEGHNDRLPALATDLVRRRVLVIAASGSSAALACEPDDQIAVNHPSGARCHDQTSIRSAREGINAALDLANIVHFDRTDLHSD